MGKHRGHTCGYARKAPRVKTMTPAERRAYNLAKESRRLGTSASWLGAGVARESKRQSSRWNARLTKQERRPTAGEDPGQARAPADKRGRPMSDAARRAGVDDAMRHYVSSGFEEAGPELADLDRMIGELGRSAAARRAEAEDVPERALVDYALKADLEECYCVVVSGERPGGPGVAYPQVRGFGQQLHFKHTERLKAAFI